MQKEESKAKLFVNWTDEDFTWKFDGDSYTIKAGESTYFKNFIAELFAKHLVDRELNKLNLPTNDSSRDELLRRCFGEEISAESEEKVENKAINLNKTDSGTDEEEEKGTPDKELPDKESNEESFEGLKKDETAQAKRSYRKKKGR